MSGCVFTSQNVACNDTKWLTFTDLAEPVDPACRIDYELAQGSILSQVPVFRIEFRPSLHVQAARFAFYQAAVSDTDPRCQQGNFSIGLTNFAEVMSHPTNSSDPTTPLLENYLSPLITREWIYGMNARRQQVDTSNPPHYFTVFTNTISSALPLSFPIWTKEDFEADQSTAVAFQITIYSNTFFRQQVVERLIQPKEAFLTILLAIIGIYHIVLFAHEVSQVLLISWHIVKNNRAFAAIKARLW
ncbi:unnamed protein product [Didymodactylos carnosus]|uniref:Uncharacterized protein n=1 Tax=Didymodactylos carnosus TaxID=1234261 RepID=A0A814SKB9_9BILA|nr:unnamed protein product [Didymodactylos carnosus]CAF1145983.1 unnamed protein product [Didymodactylos carnosus]CAF3852372.1 unnamed protein product [Didymodactylos carnosus]CAF3909563.1 unnamed protein product [Didymodactylos carnosus]